MVGEPAPTSDEFWNDLFQFLNIAQIGDRPFFRMIGDIIAQP